LKKNKVLIVDPVGCKAGMDYYDNNLVAGFWHAGVTAMIASNYTDKQHKAQVFFRSNKVNGQLFKLIDWVFGFWKSFWYARKNHISQVILHSFSAEIKDLYPYLLSKVFALRITTIVHDVSGFAEDDSSFVRNFIYKRSYNLIVHNDYSKEVLLGYLEPQMRTKLHVVPHGNFLSLPDPTITKTEARKRLKIGDQEKMILFFGQIKKQKGLDLLLNALAHTDEQIKLTIAGKPWKEKFDTYQELISHLNLKERVRLLIRYIEDSERELLFKSADLLIIPYYEIYQSGVLLMAMSYGVPVLVSDLPPNREVINHLENGLLFESGNIASLSKNIEHFFDNKEKLNYLSEKSVDLLKGRYDWVTIAQQYVRILFTNHLFI